MKRILRALLIAAFSVALCGANASQAQIPSPRQRIAVCWQSGAFNEQLMTMCTGGLFVDGPTFVSCMQGGWCFGQPPIAVIGIPPPAPGAPFCGATSQPPCPEARQCGYPGTIACPPPPGFPWPPFPTAVACGQPPYPPCQQGVACGYPISLPCPVVATPPPPPVIPAQYFNSLRPKFRVQLPYQPGVTDVDVNSGIEFAQPPLPDEDALKTCREEQTSEDAFYKCVIEQAMPADYRLAKDCVDANKSDTGRALVCSSGNADALEAYDRFKQLDECRKTAGSNEWQIAQCLGDATLGQNERYYLGCVTKNQGNFTRSAVCALSKDLTPEQQIALSCAISTGGEPHAFAVCTGTQLLSAELDKCWQHGIGTEQGCFGPNNDYRKFLDQVDGHVKTAFGEDSAVYEAYKLWKDNVLAPGPNHEVVKAFNTGLNDLKNGMGENNDLVVAGKQFEKGVQSIGRVFGF